MMKNEFVPYDIALAMKELGFEEGCIGLYYCDGSEFKLEYRETQYDVQKGWQNGVLAPLYQQAFRWFREKHGIFSWLTRHRYNITTSLGNKEYYRWGLEYEVETSEPHINSEIVYPGKEYDTYEEVELACLEKLIEIKNQNKDDD